MKNMKWTIITVLCGLCFFSFQAMAQTLWVSSGNAKLKADKSASSETVEKLDSGTELSVVSKDKKWFEVKVVSSGASGWIYKGKVSDEKPEDDDMDEDEDLMDDELLVSSVDAFSADTSRSIRGRKVQKKGSDAKPVKKKEIKKNPFKRICPPAVKYARKKRIPKKTLVELDKILSQKVSDDEIELFLKKGKIGEYAQ